MYGLDDQYSVETIRVESENAMDILSILNGYVHSFDWDAYTVTGNDYGFCCDSGSYSHDSNVDSVSEVYWALVNYGADKSKYNDGWTFEIEYVERGNYGNIDNNYPVTVRILDNAGGEYSHHEYVIRTN